MRNAREWFTCAKKDSPLHISIPARLSQSKRGCSGRELTSVLVKLRSNWSNGVARADVARERGRAGFIGGRSGAGKADRDVGGPAQGVESGLGLIALAVGGAADAFDGIVQGGASDASGVFDLGLSSEFVESDVVTLPSESVILMERPSLSRVLGWLKASVVVSCFIA